MKPSRLFPPVLKNPLKRFLQRRSLHMSQSGQDLWVISEVFNEHRRGFFLDIGAHDGLEISNTYLLEKKYGWKGICVEANPHSFAALTRNRSATCVHACLDASEQEVEFLARPVIGGIVSPDLDNTAPRPGDEVIRMRSRTLESLLREHGAPRVIDYLSIDTEGAEERILGCFDFSAYTFRCVTIERPNAALRSRFAEHGYRLVKEHPGFDAYFVHDSFLEAYRQNFFAFYEKKFVPLRWS